MYYFYINRASDLSLLEVLSISKRCHERGADCQACPEMDALLISGKSPAFNSWSFKVLYLYVKDTLGLSVSLLAKEVDSPSWAFLVQPYI